MDFEIVWGIYFLVLLVFFSLFVCVMWMRFQMFQNMYINESLDLRDIIINDYNGPNRLDCPEFTDVLNYHLVNMLKPNDLSSLKRVNRTLVEIKIPTRLKMYSSRHFGLWLYNSDFRFSQKEWSILRMLSRLFRMACDDYSVNKLDYDIPEKYLFHLITNDAESDVIAGYRTCERVWRSTRNHGMPSAEVSTYRTHKIRSLKNVYTNIKFNNFP